MLKHPSANLGAVPRLPAEWEPHRATHLAFPANSRDWPGKFAAIRWAFVEMVRHLSVGEIIRLALPQEKDRQRAERMFKDAGISPEAVEFHPFALDRGWMRDISPFFVQDPTGSLSAVLFGFTGWAKYDNHRLDAQWAAHIANVLGLPAIHARNDNLPIVLEGGAVDVNGQGALLTTEECLLDRQTQVRNPGFTKKDYEALFQEYLGIRQVLWLGSGIAGDDTHGHVDDLCRFVTPATVVLCRETNPHDDNYHALEENRERLEDVRLANGASLEVIDLPMPSPLYFQGIRLPASYANFYIANEVVIVPTFNDVRDRQALGLLGELFPERRVVGIHAVDLVWGFGTLHCLSHEEPAGNQTGLDAVLRLSE